MVQPILRLGPVVTCLKLNNETNIEEKKWQIKNYQEH